MQLFTYSMTECSTEQEKHMVKNKHLSPVFWGTPSLLQIQQYAYFLNNKANINTFILFQICLSQFRE